MPKAAQPGNGGDGVQAQIELTPELFLCYFGFRRQKLMWAGVVVGGNANLAQGAFCRTKEGVIAGARGSVLSVKHVQLQGLLLLKKVLKGQHPGEDRAGAGA